MAKELPQGARVLDVGAGDGAVAGFLLAKRPDLRFTLIDLAAEVGAFLSEAAAAKTEIRPATAISKITAEGGRYDAIIIADVVHHVPVETRASFFADLAACRSSAGAVRLLVKDIQPGSLRAWLAKVADWYVTGDRNVRLLAMSELVADLRSAFGDTIEQVETSVPDPPNYLVVFRFADADHGAGEEVSTSGGNTKRPMKV